MGAFLSDTWFKVAALRPRLRPHARVSRQRVRGKPWYVVHDPLTNRTHRFSPTAWWFANQLDGRRTVDAAWQAALDELGDAAPSQEDAIALLSQLHGADLLLSEAAPESTELLERRRRQDRPKWLAGLMNPTSVRLPLWDPDAFLARTLRWLAPFAGWRGVAVWLALVVPALLLAAGHWTELTGDLSDRLLSPANLAALALVFPCVKLLHELGHGYAVKAYGGEVHEAGIMLLVFAPAPYVDASASSGFRSKWARALVAAAGMLTELLLAAIALYVWLAVEPGAVRGVAFNVMTVAGVSTLVFNANPLLRYDGYYILCDLAEMPNLGQRANAYWGWLVQHHVFGVREAKRPDATPAERRWLLAYAPAAFAYRTGVSLSIALFIANEYFFVGMALAIWSVAGLVLVPALRHLRFLLASPVLATRRPRALAIAGGTLAATLTLAVAVPLPSSSTVQGVVWVPEGAEVRAAGTGFVDGPAVPSLAAVRPGQPLVALADDTLLARHAEQAARVEELDVQAVQEQAEDRGRAFQTRAVLEREREALDDLDERVTRLATLAQGAGTFVRASSDDLPGSYVKRGDLLGYIVGARRNVVRAVVPQDDIGLVRGALRRVEVQLADRVGTRHGGRIVRAVPQGEESLPSKALTVDGGGEFVVDPRDPAALRTLDKVFQFDVALNQPPADLRIGTRAWVRFEYAPEPLAFQLGRRLRQLLLARLHV